MDGTERSHIESDIRGEAKRLKRSRREQARTLVLLVLAVLVTVFAVLNVGSVEVDWIVATAHVPLIVVIAVSLVAGILISYVAEHRRGKRK